MLSQAELQLAIGTKTLPESLHSVPVSYVRDSEWLLLVVKIPLVAITPYEEFRVYPLPQKVNDKMLIINSLLFVSISVSKPTMTYFYESQLFIKLNDTYKIIHQPVVKNGLKNLDCIATAVLEGGKPLHMCETLQLGEDFEEIFQLQDQSRFLFYTSSHKEMLIRCGDNRIDVNFNVGVITLDHDCTLVTSKSIVHGLNMIAQTNSRNFWRPVVLSALSKITTIMPESIQIDLISDKPLVEQTDLTELEVEIFSITEPEKSPTFNTTWLSSALTALIILAAISIVLVYKYKIKQRPQPAPAQSTADMTEMTEGPAAAATYTW